MKKVDQVNELHERAMTLAEEAFILKRTKNGASTTDLYQKAFELEKEAAMMLVSDYDIEPTRSVLFKGAASLAYNCRLFREAERMIAFGLSGNPPVQIAQELRDLMVIIKTATPDIPAIDKFKQLPENLQNEVLDFIDFLMAKHGTSPDFR